MELCGGFDAGGFLNAGAEIEAVGKVSGAQVLCDRGEILRGKAAGEEDAAAGEEGLDEAVIEEFTSAARGAAGLCIGEQRRVRGRELGEFRGVFGGGDADRGNDTLCAEVLAGGGGIAMDLHRKEAEALKCFLHERGGLVDKDANNADRFGAFCAKGLHEKLGIGEGDVALAFRGKDHSEKGGAEIEREEGVLMAAKSANLDVRAYAGRGECLVVGRCGQRHAAKPLRGWRRCGGFGAAAGMCRWIPREGKHMKKILIGCGIVSLLLVTILVGLIIYGALWVKNLGTRVAETRAQIVQLDSRYPYTPAADGRLDPSRVTAYFELREVMVNRILDEPLVKRLVDGQASGQRPDIGFRDLFTLAKDVMPGIARDFRRELDDRQMSPREMADIVRNVYTTLLKGKQANDPLMTEIYDSLNMAIDQVNAVAQQTNNQQLLVSVEAALADATTIPEDVLLANRSIIAEHRDQLLDYPQLAWLEFILVSNLK